MNSKKEYHTHTHAVDEKTTREYLEQLQNEISDFEHEKEHIKKIMGDIGGKKHSYRDTGYNIIFGILALGLLIGQLFFDIFQSFISIEIAIFLVSIKMIWMMHTQHKHNHFMFWVLNTIEFRLNDVYKISRKLSKELLKEKK